MSSAAMVLLFASPAVGQAEDPGNASPLESRQLGENFVVTLVVEPAGTKESFTILTATENFRVETQVGKRIKLQFDGRIMFHESQMIIGDRNYQPARPVLVRYRIKVHSLDQQDEGGFTFGLEGSAFLEEDKEAVIARTANMTLKLKISRS
jgi:hypothetical protein